MNKFYRHTGKCAPLFEENIDTDQIVPKKFLLETGRTGYAKALFYDWRYASDGTINQEFVLNDPKYADSTILVTGSNFGCGSSREHAPWALLEYGFRVIIAPAFADIFYNNCFKIGLLPVVVDQTEISKIVTNIENNDGYYLTVDLFEQTVTNRGDYALQFDIDDFRKKCLLNGFDDIDLTLLHEKKIADFENKRVSYFNNQ